METFIKKNNDETFFNIHNKPSVDFPASTYRVQLNHQFTFKDLSSQIPYLHRLGISTIYAAPITKAIRDSSHGYDVTDFMQINPQIGTIEEFKALSNTLKQYSMSWIQDIVPNHMAFSNQNERLMDVLERGPHSPYYAFFDINWQHPDSMGQLLIPTLGNELHAVIEAGDLTLTFTNTGFYINYFDSAYPISVSAFNQFINTLNENKRNNDLIEEIKLFQEKSAHLSLADFNNLKYAFFEKIQTQGNHKVEIEWLIQKINAEKNILQSLLSEQFYTLAHWKTADTKMNYRRFFAVNTLICLRMEEESVFNEYHAFISMLYKENLIQGVRVDHIDGLYDPKQYLQRLRKLLGNKCYIIAEKILEYNEDFAKDWNIEGSSGYEFLSFTNRVLTDQEGAEKIRSNYFDFIQEYADYNNMVFEKKHAFLHAYMQGELDNLITRVQTLHLLPVETDWLVFRKALGVFISSFPVYRIYPDKLPLTPESFAIIENTYNTALRYEPTLIETLKLILNFFIYDEETCEQKLSLIKRLMQFTGPLAAKGVEDTTFYVYNPLISHNEVGDAPCELAISIDSFHDKMISRLHNNPYSLNATSTHDTKRGEDARMRINVLSHYHEEWISNLKKWHEENNTFINKTDNGNAPSLNDEYFIYQSLLGSFPENLIIDDLYIERTKNFLLKALKEAKVHTNYTDVNQEYEKACIEFTTSILNVQHVFLKSFIPFISKIINCSAIYSLEQTIIKITAPGIPDIYQGSELWDTSYVDPDNRRPIDYSFRNNLLNKIISLENNRSALIEYIKDNRLAGAEKLFIIKELLQLRNNLSELFLYGSYTHVIISSVDNKKVIAYIRGYMQQHVLVVLPVGFSYTEGKYSQADWNDVFLNIPPNLSNQWINLLTQKKLTISNSVSVADMCKDLPVAVFKIDN